MDMDTMAAGMEQTIKNVVHPIIPPLDNLTPFVYTDVGKSTITVYYTEVHYAHYFGGGLRC